MESPPRQILQFNFSEDLVKTLTIKYASDKPFRHFFSLIRIFNIYLFYFHKLFTFLMN